MLHPTANLELSIENLDQIYSLLQDSHQHSKSMLDMILVMDDNISLTDQNRKLLNNLFASYSTIVRELASVDSYLQYCDLHSSDLTVEQQRIVMDCQETYSQIKESGAKLLEFIVNTKKKMDESGCAIEDDIQFKSHSQNVSANYIEGQTIITAEIAHDYVQYRSVLSEMLQELLFLDTRHMIETATRRLDLGDRHTIHIETEHEMNILIDYGLFQYRQEGKSIVERYHQKHKGLYSGQKLSVLESLKNARTSLLKVVKPVNDNGLVVKDDLTNETLLMIDNGLHNLARLHHDHAILTHYLVMPGFIMTTGAATPVDLASTSGIQMWSIFEKLISYKQDSNFNKNKALYFQGITDLYKIVIHDNIAKQVSSNPLPMNYHGMLDKS